MRAPATSWRERAKFKQPAIADILITPISLQDRGRWAELWRGYLDFYQTRLPPEIYEHTWESLIFADRPIYGLGGASAA
jgi:hypothetical protein